MGFEKKDFSPFVGLRQRLHLRKTNVVTFSELAEDWLFDIACPTSIEGTGVGAIRQTSLQELGTDHGLGELRHRPPPKSPRSIRLDGHLESLGR